MGKLDRFMPLEIEPWTKKTARLSAAARGAYLDLLLAYWRGEALPADDDDALMRLARCTEKEWAHVRVKVLAYWTNDNGFLRQGRADEEKAKAQDVHAKRAGSGKAGGEAKAKQATKQKHSKPDSKDAATDQAPPQAKPDTAYSLHSASAEVPTSSGAVGAAVDPAKWVYDVGKGLLKTYDIAAKTSGGLITTWLKRLDPEPLLAVIANAGQQRRHDIVAFIEGSIRTRTNGRNHDNSEQQRTDREAIARAFGDRGLAPVRPAAGSVDGEPAGEHGDAAPVRVIALPARGTDGGDRPTDGLRPDVQPTDPKPLGPDRTVPAGSRAPAGGHPRQGREANHGVVEVGKPDADAGGHPRVGAPLPDAEKNGSGPSADRIGKTDNADELDIPDFLDRRQIAV